jgi:hypothetical protein
VSKIVLSIFNATSSRHNWCRALHGGMGSDNDHKSLSYNMLTVRLHLDW